MALIGGLTPRRWQRLGAFLALEAAGPTWALWDPPARRRPHPPGLRGPIGHQVSVTWPGTPWADTIALDTGAPVG
jgi:hypothetical protein